MRRVLLLALVLMPSACVQGGPRWLRRDPKPNPAIDSLYWQAVRQLDATNRAGSLDSAITRLEAYLAEGTEQRHRSEALVLRQLARDAQELARLQAALQVAQQTPERPPTTPEAPPRPRDEEALKEVQRLKDELAKANAELERIRRRLANPREP